MRSPRDRMVSSAALLIRERGAHATAIADVLEHSGAPRGSAYHYFPGGRAQLLCEAIDFASDFVAGRIAEADRTLDALDWLVATYRDQLLGSDYRAGCPVVAVAVEAGRPGDQGRTAPVMHRAAAAFTRWNDLLAQRLAVDGVETVRAEELAMLVTTAIEGAIVVARAARDVKPLDLVYRQLREILQSEISGKVNHDDR